MQKLVWALYTWTYNGHLPEPGTGLGTLLLLGVESGRMMMEAVWTSIKNYRICSSEN